MLKKIFTLLGIAATTLALQSCFDKDYDLENIDKTFAIGSNDDIIWLPYSSTGDIVIGDFLKVKDGDYIKILKDADGKDYYCLEAGGEFNMQVITPTSTEWAYMAATGATFPYSFDIPDDPNATNISIDLSNRPKSLDDLKLDLSNPQIRLVTDNGADVDITCDMTFDCFDKNNVKEATGVDLAVFTATPGTSSFYFADEKATEEPAGFSYIKSTNLHNKVIDMPNRIELKKESMKMTLNSAAALDKRYDLKNNFKLYAPLYCGPNFEFTNESNEKGLYNELEIDDDLDINIKAIYLQADIVNNMPLDLTLEAEAIDNNDKVIKNIKPLKPQMATAGTTTSIQLQLETLDKSDITAYLKEDATTKLDGVKLTIKASGNTTSNIKPLRPTDSLKVKNMRLGVSGGIVIDAN
ncbi:MAG: hypothetical protein J5671_00230 [Bacteroidaceae bacterium]|nr:hypothetical protein [Bacteroidaceae bacterium]